MSEDQNPAVIIDNGSGMIKAGIAGDDAPRTYFPSIVGRPKMPGIMVGIDAKECFVGIEALEKRGVLNLDYPIENGKIKNWENMEKIWHHVFYSELRVVPEDHPCLLTEVPLNQKSDKEKSTEAMFETFNVPSLFISISAVLALYSSGRTTGIVVDTGAGVTNTVPIYEGYALPHAIKTMTFAGQELTHFLLQQLTGSGISFSKTTEFEIVSDIKEKICYVALNPEEEELKYQRGNSMNVIYTLPDGQNVEIKSQRYICTEALFKPQLLGIELIKGKDLAGVHDMLHQSILKCDTDCINDLAQNIVLSGGSSIFEGMQERLQNELNTLAGSTYKPKVFAPTERKFSVWIGGSLLASLSSFQTMWIQKSEYEESGARIVHRKCF